MPTSQALSTVQLATLDSVLNLIIPPSVDGRMPGAAEYDVFAYLCEFAPQALSALLGELDELEGIAQAQHKASFASLGEGQAKAIIDERRAADPRFMSELARQTVSCYYQQDRVVVGIGMQARPPFPQGYEVRFGDLSLLDPVRARGQVYRDVD